MSLAAACGWTLLRSGIVAAVGAPVCWWLRRQLAALDRRPRLLLWGLLLIPFFTPALLTGYGWSNFALSLVRYPLWNEALYATLLGLRFVPVGVVLMWLAPPSPVTPEAYHAARLAAGRRQGLFPRLRILAPFALRGPLRDMFPAAAVVFLLAFQEFEAASLLGTASWTVWLFDAQAGGLLLSETLQRAVLPVISEAFVLAVLLMLVIRARNLTAAPHRWPVAFSRGPQAAAWLFALLSVAAVTGVPLVLVGSDLADGLSTVLRSPRVFEETGVALGLGVASGSVASLIAAVLLKAGRSSRRLRLIRGAGVGLLLPGLLGSLVVSLAVLWLFQHEPLRGSFYNTPLPAVVALVLFLLPRAALLFLLVAAAGPQHGLHAARLLAVSADRRQRRAGWSLVWRLGWQRYALAAGIVCIWGYLEMLPASILAPPGMRSAVVRLYEDMHYGRNAVLSTTALLVMLAPVVLWLGAALLLRAATWSLGRFRGQ